MKQPSIIDTKTKSFALRIVKLFRYLKARRETVIAKQVLRSGTSIGANVTEGRFAQSKADFVSKYAIALKEAAETLYWLEILRDGEFIPEDNAFNTLYAECEELVRLLTSSLRTAQKNMRKDKCITHSA